MFTLCGSVANARAHDLAAFGVGLDARVRLERESLRLEATHVFSPIVALETRQSADLDGDGQLSAQEASGLVTELLADLGGAGSAFSITLVRDGESSADPHSSGQGEDSKEQIPEDSKESLVLQLTREAPLVNGLEGDLTARAFSITVVSHSKFPKPLEHTGVRLDYVGWPRSPGNVHWWLELGAEIGLCNHDPDLKPQGAEQRHWLAKRDATQSRTLSLECFHQPGLAGAGELTDEERQRIDSEPQQVANLLALLDEQGSGPSVLLVATLIAFVFGAGHALSPGHGKTLVAAYLVGSRGTVAHAVFLGLVVTVSHVTGVYLVALVSFIVRRLVEIPAHEFQGRANAVLSVLSASIIVIIGMVLLWRRWRGLSGGQEHHHHGDDHHHGPDGHHHHHHGHSHGDVKRGDLLSLGISGGIVPCPTAMVIVLYAFAQNRLALGLWLVSVFSLGLAVVLVAIGVVLVKARSLIAGKESARTRRLLQWLTVLSPALIIILGTIALVVSLGEASASF